MAVRGDVSIPHLNQYNLLPAGVHECSIDEIENTFVYNSIRRQIWDSFIDYFNLIKNLSEIESIYIDGSFVTDRESPSDVDIAIEFVSLYDWGRLRRAHPELFDEAVIKERWHLDYLPCAPQMRSWQGTDARDFFQGLEAKDIEKRGIPKETKKGILVVRLEGER